MDKIILYNSVCVNLIIVTIIIVFLKKFWFNSVCAIDLYVIKFLHLYHFRQTDGNKHLIMND